jgi:hypothetical protein
MGVICIQRDAIWPKKCPYSFFQDFDSSFQKIYSQVYISLYG